MTGYQKTEKMLTALGFKHNGSQDFPNQQTTHSFSRGMHCISIQLPSQGKGKIWWVHSASGDEMFYVENEDRTYKGLFEHIVAYFNPSPTRT